MRRFAFVLAFIILAGWAFAQTKPTTRPRPNALPQGTTVLRDVPYVKDGGKSQSMDIAIPPNPTKPLPLIICVHGGGWQAGDKAPNPGAGFVRFGYVVASINYRLTQEAKWPAQIYDCKAAVRFLRAHAEEYKIDPDRVGVWGASAGGHLVALLGTSGDVKALEGDEGNLQFSSRVQCVVDLFGPTDLTKIKNERVAGDALTHLFGGPLHEHMDEAKQASPVTYVTKDDAPCLIMQGTNDPLVDPEQSEYLDEALKKLGVESHLEMIEGAGHGGPQFSTPAHLMMIFNFFNKHLKGTTTQPTSQP